MPSNKDYVVRPKWNVEMESSRVSEQRKSKTTGIVSPFFEFNNVYSSLGLFDSQALFWDRSGICSFM